MHKIITLALKDLRLLSRDWFGLFWIFAFPLLFALFFGSVMGGGEPRSSMTIALVDEDQSDGSKAFIQKLKDKDGVKVELIADRAQADELVRKGKRAAYVILLAGFGESGGFFNQRSATMERVSIRAARPTPASCKDSSWRPPFRACNSNSPIRKSPEPSSRKPPGTSSNPKP